LNTVPPFRGRSVASYDDLADVSCRRRIKWPAMDSDCRDNDKQLPIETVVSCFNRAVACVVIYIHARVITLIVEVVWRISDLENEAAANRADKANKASCATMRDRVDV
jgi:hypothetical protein